MKFKLFIMVALLCAPQAKSAETDLSMIGLTRHFSRMGVGDASASGDLSTEDLKKAFSRIGVGDASVAASASTMETAKPSPKKGIRRIVTLDDLRRGYVLRSFATYSIDGNIVKVDPEKGSVIINKVRHFKPKTETYTDYVYRVLRSKKKSKDTAAMNAERRQALMAKRRMAGIAHSE